MDEPEDEDKRSGDVAALDLERRWVVGVGEAEKSRGEC